MVRKVKLRAGGDLSPRQRKTFLSMGKVSFLCCGVLFFLCEDGNLIV